LIIHFTSERGTRTLDCARLGKINGSPFAEYYFSPPSVSLIRAIDRREELTFRYPASINPIYPPKAFTLALHFANTPFPTPIQGIPGGTSGGLVKRRYVLYAPANTSTRIAIMKVKDSMIEKKNIYAEGKIFGAGRF
jgi:hypothetical protein